MPTETTDSIVDRQPVAVFLGGLTGLIALGVGVATALDWVDLTTEQAAGIVAFVGALCGLIGSALWGAVYSPATVAELTRPTPFAPEPEEFP